MRTLSDMIRVERLRSAAACGAVVCAYVALACAVTWPLPRHLGTHLLGDPSGDLGVYVWNLWIFRHELIDHGHLPFSTDHVFADSEGIDFALHNYTPLAGLAALPLISWWGPVITFNIIEISMIATSGLGLFVLARRVGLGVGAAASAGVMFLASPVLTSRAAEHFSLVTAAPIPLFIWAVLGALETAQTRHAVIAGALVAAATYADAYYGVYCLLIGLFLAGWRFLRLQWRARASQLVTGANATVALAAAVILWRGLTGATSMNVAGVVIRLQSLYTPVLLLVLALGVRVFVQWRPIVSLQDPQVLPVLFRKGLMAVGVALLLMAPLFLGIAARYSAGRLPETATHWRSSPDGVDLLGYVVPNPLHPWFGTQTEMWFGATAAESFPEYVASFSIVGFAVIAVGAARCGLPPLWVALTAGALLLSLGPFIHVAGVNTYLPGPWALLRYVPVVGMARSPSRFAIIAVMGFSLLFAFAVSELARRWGHRWTPIGWMLAVLLAVELIPAPRKLYSANVPEVYRLVGGSDETARVLHLPSGIRDGTSSLGKFNAAYQYFQTYHRRPILGGYVSRVSARRKRETSRRPLFGALLALSEGVQLSPQRLALARADRARFLQRTCVRFVIVSKADASAELRNFAKDALGLSSIHEDSTHQLLVPIDPPPCDPKRRHGVRWLQERQ